MRSGKRASVDAETEKLHRLGVAHWPLLRASTEHIIMDLKLIIIDVMVNFQTELPSLLSQPRSSRPSCHQIHLLLQMPVS